MSPLAIAHLLSSGRPELSLHSLLLWLSAFLNSHLGYRLLQTNTHTNVPQCVGVSWSRPSIGVFFWLAGEFRSQVVVGPFVRALTRICLRGISFVLQFPLLLVSSFATPTTLAFCAMLVYLSNPKSNNTTAICHSTRFQVLDVSCWRWASHSSEDIRHCSTSIFSHDHSRSTVTNRSLWILGYSSEINYTLWIEYLLLDWHSTGNTSSLLL